MSKKNVCRSHCNQQLSSKWASETTDWYRLNHHIKSLQPFWIWVSWNETQIGKGAGGGRLRETEWECVRENGRCSCERYTGVWLCECTSAPFEEWNHITRTHSKRMGQKEMPMPSRWWCYWSVYVSLLLFFFSFLIVARTGCAVLSFQCNRGFCCCRMSPSAIVFFNTWIVRCSVACIIIQKTTRKINLMNNTV